MDAQAKLVEEHKTAVARIQEEVKYFHDNKKHFRVYHGSTSSTRPMQFKRDSIVDTSDMDRLFAVDLEAMTVQAEPKVPMDKLAEHCLEQGVLPKIVMEFKGITVGGGYSGFSGESSMYRYGLFNNTVADIEIVLGDGSLDTASRTRNADLLEHAAGSLGTFGIVTLATVELIKATACVQVEVQLVDDVSKAHEIFEAATEDESIHFIDGVYFRKGRIAVMLARFVDGPPAGQKVLKKMQVHWFADTIEDILDKKPTTEAPASIYMNTADYLFRYDHGAFWGGKLAFRHFHVPQNAITRRLADPFMDSRTCYHALHKSGLANEYVVQDFGIPASTVTEFVSFVNETLPELQIFLAPCKAPKDIGLSSRFNPRVAEVADQRIFAVGVYGRGPRDPKAFYELNRKLELRSAELLGAKLLYARTYYTEDEFWLIYDKAIYEEMRRKYKAEGLPTVFEKLKADMDTGAGRRRPVRGILETMWDKLVGNKEYLLKK
ncbi:putative fad binding domain containing protein [Drechmeria coniospora]|uniref:Delta(24)-sterol reductase n=1 Tax=Drechmeria coniospora TaxID=98403 RepID=A0A151GX27_DRECN|nr:putative fad binding domain containing protein [Drechmeria coniospora]KYK61657.1 putative fad binding domain containing protein [Drechmeria coniospora]